MIAEIEVTVSCPGCKGIMVHVTGGPIRRVCSNPACSLYNIIWEIQPREEVEVNLKEIGKIEGV